MLSACAMDEPPLENQGSTATALVNPPSPCVVGSCDPPDDPDPGCASLATGTLVSVRSDRRVGAPSGYAFFFSAAAGSGSEPFARRSRISARSFSVGGVAAGGASVRTLL